MATINILENMGTFEKGIHRAVMAETVRKHYPNNTYPAKGLLVTLGGVYTDKQGNTIPGSEMEYWVEVLKYPAKNIICVDDTKETVDRNKTNKNPLYKNIRNTYMPLSYKINEGDNCPVGRGMLGGIIKVVSDLMDEGEEIAVLSPDLMGTVPGVGNVVAELAYLLNDQKQTCLMMANFMVNARGNGGKYDASDALWNGYKKGNQTFEVTGASKYTENLSFKQIVRGNWKEESPTINGQHGFGYTGTAPMQTVFLVKKGTAHKSMKMHLAGIKAAANRKA